jgi:Tfp pilus assembly protein FimT
MKRPPCIRERGLSLVELLLGLAIAAMVLAPLVPMLATASAAARIGGDQLAVERDADFALERISARIRATSAAAELTGSSCGPGPKSAAYEVKDVNEVKTLIETQGKDKYVLAEYVTCITLTSVSSSSEQPTIQVSLNLKRGDASTAATAVVPLGVAP